MSKALANKNSELVAARWSKALIELTLEDSNISKDAVLSDLREISETISSSDELFNVISNPAVSVNEKQIVLCKLFENRVMPLVYNFIFALNLRKRVDIISQIADEFEKELDKIKNIIHVGVTSAINIGDEKKDDIKNKLATKLAKDVIIDWNIDEEIIAGLIFKIDEQIVDNSIRHKLDDLSNVIIKR